MFFFFPFYAQGQASPNGRKSSPSETLLFLPRPGNSKSRDPHRAWDFGDFAVDLMRQTLSMVTSSLTALGNAANALFAQTTAALALNRVAQDTARFLDGGWFGSGAAKAGSSPFGPYRQMQDPMSFSPFLTQGFNPFAINPWAAFAEGMNFWTSLWMPAAPHRNPYSFGRSTSATPFMAKVSTPHGFSWGFSWGA